MAVSNASPAPHGKRNTAYSYGRYGQTFTTESTSLWPEQQIHPPELGLLPDPGFGWPFRVGLPPLAGTYTVHPSHPIPLG